MLTTDPQKERADCALARIVKKEIIPAATVLTPF
jgi:hypothetical protein